MGVSFVATARSYLFSVMAVILLVGSAGAVRAEDAEAARPDDAGVYQPEDAELGPKEDAGARSGSSHKNGSIRTVIATIPRIRVFCSPCIDSYAQEIVPRSVAWASRGILNRDRDATNGSEAATPPGWRREDGALRIARPSLASNDQQILRLLIDGGAFDPATVYVLVDESWQNLAILFGLAADRALPTLESYIPVQRAPLQGHVPGEEAW